ncbi:hypothetical protein [uncultured Aliiroseovarius sp.]|uniref:hypothetical protein n=1 Tax=uncultured Aliiroseovarius sp. TaxID=1658783 RepID=UPI0025943A6C|nr:hypothetical protein [uncultured Aliiroseovarius sp.]
MRIAIWVWNWLRRTATLLVFLVMLLFLVISHTVESVAFLTTNAIEMATGLASVSTSALTGKSSLENQLAAEKVKSRNQAKTIERLENRSSRLSKETKLASAKADALQLENNKLKAEQHVTFRGKTMSAKAASVQVTGGIQARTKGVAVTNLASVVGESIPFYGIAIIAGATTYELKAACDTMEDLYDLQIALNPEETSDESRSFVCGLQVPTKDEIWQSMADSPSKAWSTAVSAYDGSSEWISKLEAPDFTGRWSRMMAWLSGWFE